MTDNGTRHPQLEGTEIVDSVLDLIGETPMVRMKRVSEEHNITCVLAMKHEVTNPGGSSKDRPALEMILAAEASGDTVDTNGDVTDTLIADPGLNHEVPPGVPALPAWGLLVLAFSLLVAGRRGILLKGDAS